MCNPAFESAVIKIQRGEAENMTDDEKDACKRLKLEIGSGIPNPRIGSNGGEISISERIAMRKRKRSESKQRT